jgi:TolA-binding protein
MRYDTGKMMRAPVCLFIAVAALAAADKPSREIQELQRDVAQLDQTVKTLQQALEARLTAMTTQITQIGANADALQKSVAQIAQDQDRKLVPAISGQGTRIDQYGATLSTMQQAIADLTTAVNRLQTQVVDVGNAVKIIQIPTTPPKPAAADLLQSASGDQLGGKYDLAVQEYSDYLKYYADSPEADIALFGLGMTHYAMKDFASAVRDYDALVAKYTESKKLPEALLYKSKSLTALKRVAESRAVCQDLRKRFPASDSARQCPVTR